MKKTEKLEEKKINKGRVIESDRKRLLAQIFFTWWEYYFYKKTGIPTVLVYHIFLKFEH